MGGGRRKCKERAKEKETGSLRQDWRHALMRRLPARSPFTRCTAFLDEISFTCGSLRRRENVTISDTQYLSTNSYTSGRGAENRYSQVSLRLKLWQSIKTPSYCLDGYTSGSSLAPSGIYTCLTAAAPLTYRSSFLFASTETS